MRQVQRLPLPLTPDAPLWEWAYDAIVHRVEGMLDHVEAVREGSDIEAVHDMRVGSRRLAAAMRVFRGSFPERRYTRLFREAQQVTRDLGAVRDLDVLIDHFERQEVEGGRVEEVGRDYFLAIHGRARRKARRPMLRSLRDMEETAFSARLSEYLRQAVLGYTLELSGRALLDGRPDERSELTPDPRGPFRSAAPLLLEQRYEALYAFEPYVHSPEAVTELHDMRIAAKWLRYTMELFAPAYDGRLKGPLDVVKGFQELLGDLHDTDVRIEILQRMLAERLDARGMEEIGSLRPDEVRSGLERLLARERRARLRRYKKFAGEWRKQEKAGFAASCLRRIREPDAPALEELE